MNEKAYEKHAWILLLVIAIIGLLFSSMYLLGITVEPLSTMSSLGRALGLVMLWAGVSTGALVIVSYRKGERGAWYALWMVPVVSLGYMALNLSYGGSFWPVFIVVLILALLGLLLPYRKFFPSKAHPKA